jgi:hypothetical protein
MLPRYTHRLNMGLDLQSLFGLHDRLCRFKFLMIITIVKNFIFKNLPSILLDSEQKVWKAYKVEFQIMNILMCNFSKSVLKSLL